MRAMVIDRFGGPEVFQEREVPRPAAGPGEVLVRVAATSVNPVDAKIRAAGAWAGITPPAVLGYDVSGTVEEAGPGVASLRIGEEVYFTPEIHGNQHGSFAEFIVAPASIVAPKPEGLDHIAAAAIPLAGGTAWEGIVRRLQVRPGETVLVLGGAGGVGSFAVQFAKAAGARVLATASEANRETLTALGADVVIDYRTQDVVEASLAATAGIGVHALMDTVGAQALYPALGAVRAFGRIATILGGNGDIASVVFKNQALHGIFLPRERARLEEMAPLFSRGVVRPLIDEVLPLREVARAHRRLDTGHGRGKIVLQV
ncbi:MAG: zinc-binding dehydrogenase [Thermaerobacter sp.]|nr:zinc-binding dehydrogenase [Thermaerobacter sp.]